MSSAESEAYAKARKENDEMFQRIGYRSIIERMVEGGKFEKEGYNKMQSVRLTVFEEAVKVLAVENGK